MEAIDFNLDDSTLTIRLPEQLNIDTVSHLWQPALKLAHEKSPDKIQVNANNTQSCDSAGIAFLVELQKTGKTQIEGLSHKHQIMLEKFEALEKPKVEIERSSPQFTRIGQYAANFGRDIGRNVGFIGEMVYFLGQHIRHPSQIRWGDFWNFIERVGPNAMPLAALLGFILGLILSFQAIVSLAPYGAEIFTVNLVNISLMRELAPLMMGIILAGRTASAFTAELGTMKINQEIDALMTMGLEPTPFLILPRVCATIVMAPIINLYIIIFGYIGCYVVMMTTLHSWSIFIHQLMISFHFNDFITGMIKSVIFGVIIGSIGCIRGLKTKSYATAVGESTTKSVVSSIVMLGIADGLITFIFYIIGK